jgi:hypothetical protein
MSSPIKKPKGHTPVLSLPLMLFPFFKRAASKLFVLHGVGRHQIEVLCCIYYALKQRKLDSIGVYGIYDSCFITTKSGRTNAAYRIQTMVTVGVLETVPNRSKTFSYKITPKGYNVLQSLEHEMYKYYLKDEKFHMTKPKLELFGDVFTHLNEDIL